MSSSIQSITSLETVLDLAIWLEQQGEAFYTQAAATAGDELSPLFAELAVRERRHGEIYRELYGELTGRDDQTELLLGEYGRFINLLCREITRSLAAELPASRPELLARALRFEKDTLLYFQEIRMLFAPTEQVAIDRICAEEKSHLALLLARIEQPG